MENERERRWSGEGKHYYEVLGVEKGGYRMNMSWNDLWFLGSSPGVIRSAFLKKSKENHPDRNPDDKKAVVKMNNVIQANSVLTAL